MGDQRGQISCCVCRCLGTRSENTRDGGKCLAIKSPGRRIWQKWLLGSERSHQPKSKNVDGVFDERPDLISVLVVSTSIIRNPDPRSPESDFQVLCGAALDNVLKLIEQLPLLTFTVKPNIYGCLAARLCGVRSIATISGFAPTYLRWPYQA